MISESSLGRNKQALSVAFSVLGGISFLMAEAIAIILVVHRGRFNLGADPLVLYMPGFLVFPLLVGVFTYNKIKQELTIVLEGSQNILPSVRYWMTLMMMAVYCVLLLCMTLVVAAGHVHLGV